MAKRKAGQIVVELSSEEALLVAQWIKWRGLPSLKSQPKTLLGRSEEARVEEQAALKAFQQLLEARGRRKRQRAVFDIAVDRQNAASLVSAFKIVEHVNRKDFFSFQPVPVIVLRLVRGIETNLKNRRGRKKLTSEERRKRLSGEYAVSDRQKNNVAQTVRRENAFKLWFEEVHRRGETILTTKRPMPRKSDPN